MRRIALLAAVTRLTRRPPQRDRVRREFPETIALPNGWLPEGIAIAPGGTFYSGSRANGAVYAGSLRTGEGDIVVPGAGRDESPSVSTTTAGACSSPAAGTGDGFVYDAESGATIAKLRLRRSADRPRS